MHVTFSNILELAMLILGGGGVGAGAKGISKVTRLAVAVENAVKAIEAIITEVKNVQGTLTAHTVMLAEHGQQLQHLQAQQQAPPSVTVVPVPVAPAQLGQKP